MAIPGASFRSKNTVSDGKQKISLIHTHGVDGVKNSLAPNAGVARLAKLVVLFWREKAGCPIGLLPLAFSDIPRSWRGTDSSIEEAIDALLEAPEGDNGGECARDGRWSSSTSESSSSPIAKALFSSGTLLSVGVRGRVGLRILSTELFLWDSSPFSFFCWF